MSLRKLATFVALAVTPYLLPYASAQAQSCTAPISTPFGLGGLIIPPANNVATAAPTGPYKVGVSFGTYCFEGRSLTLSYWYPASPAAGAAPYVSAGGILGKAVKDAPVDTSGGPYPLIVFASGLGAWEDAYYFYVQNLASHGYFVVSAKHLDATNANITSNVIDLALAAVDAAAGDTNDAVLEEYTEWFRDTQFALTYRPQEIEFGLNQTIYQATVNQSSPFYGVVDTDNIGMSGHSLGGFYTNVIGGGLPLYCDYIMTPAQMDPTWPVVSDISPCAFPARQSLSGPFALHDPRIKAIAALAAPSFLTKTQIARSAAQIEVPMLVLTGDNTTAETTLWIQEDAYDNAAGPSHWVKVNDTTHYMVADAYGLNPFFQSMSSAQDVANFPEKAAVYMTYSSAFFDYYIKGNKTAYTTLTTVSSSFVEELKFRNQG
ncbi:Alpha/Beta hydrolase protein [Xylariales sp. PMI_506]|nr:Alpha/Beta hydrolase protein [Xylariales sp. PMI_506]